MKTTSEPTMTQTMLDAQVFYEAESPFPLVLDYEYAALVDWYGAQHATWAIVELVANGAQAQTIFKELRDYRGQGMVGLVYDTAVDIWKRAIDHRNSQSSNP